MVWVCTTGADEQITGLQLLVRLQGAWDSMQPDSGKRFNLAASMIDRFGDDLDY